MIKKIYLKCVNTGQRFEFSIGAGPLATLQDVIERLGSEETERLLEAVNRMIAGKSEVQRTAFMMNRADGLCTVNYSSCGNSLNLLDVEQVKQISARFTPEQAARIRDSLEKWNSAHQSEGIIAFEALYYCRKCKKLTQGIYFKMRSIENGKEKVYVHPNRCDSCKSDLVLVNDSNMGFMYEGMIVRAPCPECGGTLVVDGVLFKPQN